VQHVGKLIINGQLGEGDSIDPSELQKELGVSRSVVREALRALGGKGLVGARPKHGTYVAPRDQWSLLDHDVLQWTFESQDMDALFRSLIEVRLLVEPGAARFAATRRIEQDLVDLRQALADMRGHLDPKGAAEADLMFHRSLFRAAHNELLSRMQELVVAGLWMRDLVVHREGGLSQENLDLHERVLDALERRDPPAAEHAVRELLRFSARSTNIEPDAIA
jgi:DNA-binding FadR family transcriptional regulator